MMRYLIIVILINFQAVFANDDFWKETEEKYKQVHWSTWIRKSPAYMGPNALPVPEVKKGYIPDSFQINTCVEIHHSKGDPTQNIFIHLIYPFSGRVAVEAFWVPVEHYFMSNEIQTIRKTFILDSSKWAVGDVNLATHIKLLGSKHDNYGLLTSFTLRTASGSNAFHARYTDSPGYFMDISGFRKFKLNNFVSGIQVYSMLGLYVWQISSVQHYQNDAVLYGSGLSFFIKNWKISSELAGYYGYLNDGDRPMVFREKIEYQMTGKNFYFRFQQGIHDFDYSSFSIGSTIYLKAR